MKRSEKDTAGQQIADLCQDHGISPKSPAEKSGVSHEEPVFRTFEELLLTEEEREERRKKIEEDKALAAYYRKVFEDPEAYFVIQENSEDEIPEDDPYIWDKEI